MAFAKLDLRIGGNARIKRAMLAQTQSPQQVSSPIRTKPKDGRFGEVEFQEQPHF
jgi:hypothetical protein